MDFASCPFCDSTVPSSELERSKLFPFSASIFTALRAIRVAGDSHASILQISNEDGERVADLQIIAIFPRTSSKSSSSMNSAGGRRRTKMVTSLAEGRVVLMRRGRARGHERWSGGGDDEQ
ncbi:hypothetical protein CDL15_Pgr007142 [Punica granatum]|uniref:Uncharacterized protein n=1 Tax=Punica granatum TaxID=22663 RepID=A0A218X9C0_PUNGR|nr:hypothetical protein CDL15_Pgr007142 [Punica granatum]PKI54692.1 hypothetical protein CRG98_024892 [Punica granatum]